MLKVNAQFPLCFHCTAGLLLMVVLSPAQAQIKVTDYGAKGDGKSDDTAAIQKAFDSVWGTSERFPDTAYYTELSPVVFPTGKYRISNAIRITNTTIRGEGAIIEQTDPEKDIFECSNAWRISISGFTFLSGRRHLNLSNPNLDSGALTIQDCRFYGSADAAMRIDVQSTNANVRDCIWLKCMQAAALFRSDQVSIRDCWITSHADMKDKAVIEHKAGRLSIDNLCGVPLVNGTDQRWIDNHGQWLSAVRCRFGGEYGGFTPVVNFAKPNHGTRVQDEAVGTMVLIEDSLICSVGNKKRSCAVYCEEVPNSIVIRNCATYTPEILVRPTIDPATYFEGVPKTMLQFVVENNSNEAKTELPDLLKQAIAR